MAGLGLAIHASPQTKHVNAQDEPGHDDVACGLSFDRRQSDDGTNRYRSDRLMTAISSAIFSR